MTIKKIDAGRVITADIDTFIGTHGTIWYDEETGEMRLYNGEPGGVPIGGGGGGGAGPRGPSGASGPQGPQGVQGSTGPSGVRGPQGVQGPQGVAGNTGATGPQGVAGNTGATGPQGVAGNTGERGPQGDIGPSGAQGFQGDQGFDGPSGARGPQGPQGPVGGEGPQGPQGAQGFQGDEGPQGPQGIQGPTGATGPKGNDGSFGGAAFSYIYSNITVDQDPTSGHFAFDATPFQSVTEMYISFTDETNTSVFDFLNTIDDSTSAIKGHFSVTDKSNSSNMALFAIVGSHYHHGDYFEVPVAFLSGSLTFTDALNVIITFARTGDAGDTGPSGPTGPQGASGPSGVVGSVGSINSQNTITDSIFNITSLNFDTDAGFSVINLSEGVIKISNTPTPVPSFKFITVSGQSTLTAKPSDTLNLIAGTGITITTSNTDDPQSITINSTGGGGGTSNVPIKTFNIIGDFGTLPGVARFTPPIQDVIRSVVLTVGFPIYQDLMVGLYRNGEFVSFFTVRAGQFTATYTNLAYTILPSEFYTVSVVAGSATNFSMALYNIDL